MYIEHVVYSLALALFICLFLDRSLARWCIAILVVSSCIPDIDGIFSLILSPPQFTDGIIPHMAFHLRYFHTAGFLAMYAVVVAGLLFYFYRLDVRLTAFLAGTGFGAHLFEDALVYNPASAVFWPVSSEEYGIGIFSSTRDFLHIANGEVLFFGILLLALATGMYTIFGKNIREDFPTIGLPSAKDRQFPSPIPAITEFLLLFFPPKKDR
jgi:LexA-binding, inner membrane-associated putative hydrolase